MPSPSLPPIPLFAAKCPRGRAIACVAAPFHVRTLSSAQRACGAVKSATPLAGRAMDAQTAILPVPRNAPPPAAHAIAGKNGQSHTTARQPRRNPGVATSDATQGRPTPCFLASKRNLLLPARRDECGMVVVYGAAPEPARQRAPHTAPWPLGLSPNPERIFP